MRKVISFILVFTLFLSPASPAFAVSGLPKLELSDKLKDLIKDSDTDELAFDVRLKLDSLRGMSDEELYAVCRDFCDKYDVEISDRDLSLLVSFVKSAMDFDVEQIKDTINEIKNSLSLIHRALEFLGGIAVRARDFFAILSDAASDFIDNVSAMFG